MPKIITLFAVLQLLCISVLAQRTYVLSASHYPIEMGGWNDLMWRGVPLIDSFTTHLPVFGRIPQRPTTAQMCLAGDYLLIKADCFTHGAVRDDASLRDQTGTADYFMVSLDTWHDGQNAFEFVVTAAGQQSDARITGSQRTASLHLPWTAEVETNSDKWSVCLVIPLSAIGYSTEKLIDWGVQFTRFDRSTGETTTWSPDNPLTGDRVYQYGHLTSHTHLTPQKRYGIAKYNDFGKNTESLIRDKRYVLRRQNEWGDGLDFQWGLGPAVNFHSTIFPGRRGQKTGEYDWDYATIAFYDYFTTMERPIVAESFEVFGRTGNIDPLPFWNLERPDFVSFDSIENRNNRRILNSHKIVAQTKNNFRIGVANTIFTQNNYKQTLPNEEYRSITNRPFYNALFAEKMFRANSFIQLAMVNALTVPGQRYSQLSSAGQWRDAQNRYQLKYNYISRPFNSPVKNLSRKAEGEVSVGKVNGSWIYEASYRTPNNLFSGTYTLAENIPHTTNVEHEARAFVAFRNFQPRSRYWLNYQASIGYNRFWYQNNMMPIIKPLDLFYLRIGGLNRRFQCAELTIKTNNLATEEVTVINGIEFYKNLGFPYSAQLLLKTDNRKRWQFSTSNAVYSYQKSPKTQLLSENTLQYVPNRTWNFAYNVYFVSDLNQITPVNINVQNQYFFKTFHTFQHVHQLNILWRFRSYFSVQAGFLARPGPVSLNEKLFKTNNDGQFEPSDLEIPKQPKDLLLTPIINIQYQNGPSQFRLYYRYVYNKAEILVPEYENFIHENRQFNVSYIIVFHQETVRRVKANNFHLF